MPAGLAAVAIARGDKMLVLDNDLDRLKGRIPILRPKV
jgi:hypothetical protein